MVRLFRGARGRGRGVPIPRPPPPSMMPRHLMPQKFEPNFIPPFGMPRPPLRPGPPRPYPGLPQRVPPPQLRMPPSRMPPPPSRMPLPIHSHLPRPPHPPRGMSMPPGRPNFMPPHPPVPGMAPLPPGPPLHRPIRPGPHLLRGRGSHRGGLLRRGVKRLVPPANGPNQFRPTSRAQKKKVRKEEVEASKPWVTDALKTEIHKKYELFKTAQSEKKDSDWEAYKTQRNLVTEMTKAAKLEYIGSHPEVDVNKIMNAADLKG